MVAENQQQMQVRLPDSVTLTLTPNEVITTMGALQEYGPYKAIFLIVRKIEQQLMAQQIKPEFKGPPPGDPSIADLEARHIPV